MSSFWSKNGLMIEVTIIEFDSSDLRMKNELFFGQEKVFFLKEVKKELQTLKHFFACRSGYIVFGQRSGYMNGDPLPFFLVKSDPLPSPHGFWLKRKQ